MAKEKRRIPQVYGVAQRERETERSNTRNGEEAPGQKKKKKIRLCVRGRTDGRGRNNPLWDHDTTTAVIFFDRSIEQKCF